MSNENTVIIDHQDNAELHTIIAALRFWQEKGMGDPDNRSDEMHDLATNGGEVFSSLDDEGIDTLVQDLNLGAISLVQAKI